MNLTILLATRVIGLFAFVTLVIANIVMRQQLRIRDASRALRHLGAARGAHRLLLIGALFWLCNPFFYVTLRPLQDQRERDARLLFHVHHQRYLCIRAPCTCRAHRPYRHAQHDHPMHLNLRRAHPRVDRREQDRRAHRLCGLCESMTSRSCRCHRAPSSRSPRISARSARASV